MAKNILVLTGSPRKGGNSDKMADAFIEEAKKAGHEVQKYVTGEKNIKGCIACDRCFSKGSACALSDDFNTLAPMVEDADVVVLATPLYWFTFPAQLKAALDKFHSFLLGQKQLAGKECLLMACSASPTENTFDGMVITFKQIAGHLGWKESGILTVPGVVGRDDVLKTDAIERVKALANSIK